MIKKGTRYLLLPLLFISMCVCAGAIFFRPLEKLHSPSRKPVSTAKSIKGITGIKHVFAGQITDFVIPEEIAPAAIDQAHGIIGIAVHAGQDITNLTPTITVTPGSTVTPSSGVPNDFTNAPLYTVDPNTTPVHYNVQVFHAATASGCSNVPSNLTGTPSAPSGIYEWQILDENTHTWSSAPAPNNNLDYTTQPIVNNTASGVRYTFRRAITTMVGTAYDSYTDLTVYPVIPITGNSIIQPSAANSTFCASGDPGTIQGNPAGGGDGNPQYQWQSSVGGGAFGNIPGATGQNYAPSTITATTKFQRTVTSGDCNAPTTSNSVTITILPAISNNHIFPPGTITFCGSSIPTIINGTNPPSGGAGSGTFQYQWQSSTDGTNFTDIPSGAHGNDYNAPALTQTTYFQRLAKSGACSAWVPSDNIVVITIQAPLSANTVTPTGPTAFCGNGDPAPITGSDVTGGDGTPVYKWESSPDGGAYQPIPGAIGRDYNPPPLNATIYYHRVVTSGSCTTPSISAPVEITVQPTLAGNAITNPANTTFCGPGGPGAIGGSIPTGGSGIYNIVWQSSVNGGPFTDIPNSNLQNYDPGMVSQTTVFQRTVTSGNCGTPLVSNQVTITIQQPLSANNILPNGPITFCQNGDPAPITGSDVTGGDGTPVYSWESSPDGVTYQLIPGEGGRDYNPPPLNATVYYHRLVTSGSCTTASISDPVKITIQPPVTNYDITPLTPANSAFCVSGSPGTIKGDLPQGGDGTYTYVWQSSVNGGPMTDIPNTNAQNYDPGVISQSTVFQRAVISGSCTVRAVSSQVLVKIQPALANNTINPPPAVNFCQTADAAPITGNTPTGGDGVQYNYQWQSSPTNSNFTNIDGAIQSTYNPPPTNVTMFYQRVVTSGACSTPLVSNVIEIHVTQPVDPTSNKINPPLITNNCTSVDPATIIGSIPSGGDGPNSFNYQWEMSTDNGTTWVPVGSGGNAADYDPPPITQSTMYHRNVTSGYCTVAVTSNVVTLTIVDSPPNITISPAAPVCAGERATLSIASPDAALTYNWYDTPTKDNLLFQGPVFETAALTANQTFYAEASNGTCSSPQLASVDVTVNPLPEVPVLDDAEPAGCKGSPAILKVANPQNSITYKWYAAATGGTALFTGTEFITPVLTDDITYYVEATNASGCISASRAGAAITVYPLPIATAQGASICPGSTAVLTSNDPDPDQTINWYEVPTGGTPVGTGSTFTTPVLNSNTSYYAEAVNTVSGCISATRAEAKVQMLTPLPAPVVHVTAAAAPDLTFTWVPVDGAIAYQVSTDNGVTFTDPSSGQDGTSHTVTGLQVGQTVTILVRALGNTACETSPDSKPVMGIAAEPNVDKIFVANAFTPNGDGKNDIVYVHNDNIKTLKFYIYDQWGNMLFQSQSPQKGWDGTYKGKLQPVGVYVYYLEAIMNDGQPVTKKGTITLLR